LLCQLLGSVLPRAPSAQGSAKRCAAASTTLEILSRHLTEKVCCVCPLTLLDNTILVLHIGYVTKGQYRRCYRETVANVAAYCRQESSEF
jgi:hypothetical protein